MKLLNLLIGLAVVSLSLPLATRAALPQPDLLMQIYFAGAQKISAAPNSVAFTNEFCSTEAVALRNQTAGKLSVWLAGWLQQHAGATVPDGAAKLRPLFDDLQSAEFLLEMREAAGGQVETAIAIKLPPARAQLWEANLKPFFATASFKPAGGWLIFDSNPNLLGLGNKLAQRLATPPAGWFAIDVNWPKLAQWYPTFKSLELPETQLTVTAPDNDFRINGKFYFPENLTINLEPWRVPTNTIHTPFNSFTAVRGFAGWYRSQPWAQPYQISPTPNQLITWSLPSFPFQNYAAIPVPDASSALDQAYEKLKPIMTKADFENQFLTSITPEMATNRIVFKGVPYAGLELKALVEPSGKFLYAELFPNSPRSSETLPPKLFERLATKDLVYYHWEITASRIPQLLHVTQLGLMITLHKQLDANSASYKWLQRIGAVLGNNDTEITQSGQAELTFARKTPGVFTAMEFFALANWVEATNFPGFDISLPPPSPRLRQHQHEQKQLQLLSAPPSH